MVTPSLPTMQTLTITFMLFHLWHCYHHHFTCTQPSITITSTCTQPSLPSPPPAITITSTCTQPSITITSTCTQPNITTTIIFTCSLWIRFPVVFSSQWDIPVSSLPRPLHEAGGKALLSVQTNQRTNDGVCQLCPPR